MAYINGKEIFGFIIGDSGGSGGGSGTTLIEISIALDSIIATQNALINGEGV